MERENQFDIFTRAIGRRGFVLGIAGAGAASLLTKAGVSANGGRTPSDCYPVRSPNNGSTADGQDGNCCSNTSVNGICSPGGDNGRCVTTQDCQSGLTCVKDAAAANYYGNGWGACRADNSGGSGGSGGNNNGGGIIIICGNRCKVCVQQCQQAGDGDQQFCLNKCGHRRRRRHHRN